LGVEPVYGRTFRQDEDAPGRDDVVLISHELWVRRFGARPNLLDAPITLDGRPHAVVGVLAPRTLFPTGKQLHPLVGLGARVDVWRPMAFTESQATSEGSWNYGVVGRLAPGVSAVQAERALNAVAQSISTELRSRVPGLDFDLTVHVSPLRDVFSRTGREGLRTIALAAALLCFIACVNLAHLWLGRIAVRERELTVRAALGASRQTILRQLFTEAATLAVPGAAIGLALSQLGARTLIALGPSDLASMDVGRLDFEATAFAIGTAALVALLAAAGPIARAVHVAAGHAVAGRYAGRGVRQSRTRRILVAAETAVCTGMLGVSALLLHSFANVLALDRGFVAEQVLAVDLALPAQPYSGDRVVPFYAEILDRLHTLPGVRAVAATSAVPLVTEESTTAVFFDSDERYVMMDRPLALQRGVTTGYFETMMIPLVAGRVFGDREPEPVVIVSALLARQLWPSDPEQAAIGRRVRPGDVKGPLRTIVGVVGDVRDGALDRRSLPAIYRPHAQFPSRAMTIVARTSGPVSAVAAAFRSELRGLDPNLPVVRMRPMADVVVASVAPRRFQSLIIGTLSALALALACIGVYGASSYAVNSGIREVGVRVALGAAPGSVLRLVFLQGFGPVLFGVAIGLGLAPIASSLVRHLLFQVGPLDPLALGGVCLVLLTVAGVVCYLPARRAAHIDPVSALRRD
jgi:putative ABC transport system permease protein